MIDGVITVAQCREMASLDGLFERRLQSFSVGQEIQRLDVLRLLFEFCFGELFRLAREVAKLRHDLRIDLVVAVCVERLVTIKRNLQASRFIESLDPDARRQQLIAAGMIRIELNDLFEVALCFVVVDIVKSIESAAPQLIEACAFCIR